MSFILLGQLLHEEEKTVNRVLLILLLSSAIFMSDFKKIFKLRKFILGRSCILELFLEEMRMQLEIIPKSGDTGQDFQAVTVNDYS